MVQVTCDKTFYIKNYEIKQLTKEKTPKTYQKENTYKTNHNNPSQTPKKCGIVWLDNYPIKHKL
jgi:hypothetical protein